VNDIAGNLAAIRARIAAAAAAAGRSPQDVRLLAVSKTFSADHVRAAYAAGQRDFGENKVQEALQKIAETTELEIRWHLIGHLQSNKAKRAGSRFDVVQSVDSAALLKKIDEGAAAENRTVDLFVQVDLAGEATKFGARPTELTEIFAATQQAANVRVVGLMLIPPAVDDPEDARPYFRKLRQLRDDFATSSGSAGIATELSMGMSNDFEVAVEEGATVVRVGSAIFGARAYP